MRLCFYSGHACQSSMGIAPSASSISLPFEPWLECWHYLRWWRRDIAWPDQFSHPLVCSTAVQWAHTLMVIQGPSRVLMIMHTRLHAGFLRQSCLHCQECGRSFWLTATITSAVMPFKNSTESTHGASEASRSPRVGERPGPEACRAICWV